MGMTDDEKKKILIEHEGFELDPYEDKLGYLTGGIGHKMTKEDMAEFNPKWDPDRKRQFWVDRFEKDFGRASTQAIAYMNKYNIPPKDETQFVLTSMMFQLGETGGHFPNMFKALSKGDVDTAVKEMKTSSKKNKPSDWYVQTPQRVEDLAKILESS